LKKPSFIVYRDSKYGFTLQIPRWWKSYIVVGKKVRPDDAEYAVYFMFKYKGKVYGEVLTLLVYRLTLKQWRERGFDDSPVNFITEHNGRIFAYTLPEELPDAFLDKTKQDYDYKKFGRPIRLMKRMVNEDAPAIVKTLRFSTLCIKTKDSSRPGPLRSSKVWPRRRMSCGK
jgi:hypothetical protein